MPQPERPPRPPRPDRPQGGSALQPGRSRPVLAPQRALASPPTLTRRGPEPVEVDPTVGQSGPSTTVSGPPTGTTGAQTGSDRVLGGRDRDVLRGFLALRSGGLPAVSASLRAVVQAVLDGSPGAELSREQLGAVRTVLAIRDVQRMTGPGVGGQLGQRSASRPGLVLDGQTVRESSEELEDRLAGRLPEQAALMLPTILSALIATGTFALRTEELLKLVVEITEKLALPSVPPTDWSTAATVVRRMTAEYEAPYQLQRTLNAKEAAALLPGQAHAVNQFLKSAPSFLAVLRRNGVKFTFNAVAAKGLGGKYEAATKELQLEPLQDIDPATFLRLFLHETGHATFQQDLLGPTPLPDSLNAGSGATLLARRAALLQALNDPTGPGASLLGPQQRESVETELAKVESELQAQGVLDAVNRLDEDTQQIYRAWQVLREADGANLLGLDLGAGRSPAKRQTYQAGTFTEFLAEVFMQTATGEIVSHITAMLEPRDGDDPRVRNAWRDVLDVLARRAMPLLKG
ncbi:hypothetical protein [Plantactinospora sp. BC1]|uniref:hypothetical protein n=1 Tax=Plantactinospora sp. BC1 TaxID=2108470 RepID=UPI00131F2BA2|nr:hypothetical protein [Plantactinospora sp. BC1]